MPFLEVVDICKRFGAVQALDGVTFSAERGQIIAVLGENGAGKTTLANVLFGLYRADEGQISLNGESLNARTPAEALDAGIGMIHQHFNLVDTMTAAENIVLGLPRRLRRGDPGARITGLASTYGFEVDPKAETGGMPVGMRQRVEILKALYRDVSVLILDEPTSVLAPGEVDGFLAGIRALRDDGMLIFFVTHKLDEVMATADRVLVMRQGRLEGDHITQNTTTLTLSCEMVGREIAPLRLQRQDCSREPMLTVSELSVLDARGAIALNAISLTVHAGEVLGIAGVDGNGQRELSEVLAGLHPIQQGTIGLNGLDLTALSPKDRNLAGVGFVPEDRHATGLVLSLSVAENLVLRGIDTPPASRGCLIDRRAIAQNGAATVNAFDIRPRDASLRAAALSGGNQQKIVLAREIAAATRLLIVVQPTKGLDVGATAFVQERIAAAADEGIGVLYISTELEHVVEIADRIAVISRGQITGVLRPDEATAERIGLLMGGQMDSAT
jgi:simple sugar transport system ATP-binding protein